MELGRYRALFSITMVYGLDGRGLIPGMVRFFLLHSVPTSYGVQPASYSMDKGGSFPGGKAAGT
jgi:hypothetical protein